MAVSDKQVVVVLGSTQGIGLALVQNLLQKNTDYKHITEDAIIIGTTRKLNHASFAPLKEQYPTRFVEELLDITSEESVNALVASITEKYGRVDLVIHNAGVCFDPLEDTFEVFNRDLFIKTIEVNVLALSYTFHQFLPLLNATHTLLGGVVGSTPTPLAEDATKDNDTKVRYIYLSTMMSSMELHTQPWFPMYRASKAAANHCFRDIALHVPWLSLHLIHPGWVATAMTEGSAAQITPVESAQGILHTISERAYAVSSTKHLLAWDNTIMPW